MPTYYGTLQAGVSEREPLPTEANCFCSPAVAVSYLPIVMVLPRILAVSPSPLTPIQGLRFTHFPRFARASLALVYSRRRSIHVFIVAGRRSHVIRVSTTDSAGAASAKVSGAVDSGWLRRPIVNNDRARGGRLRFLPLEDCQDDKHRTRVAGRRHGQPSA